MFFYLQLTTPHNKPGNSCPIKLRLEIKEDNFNKNAEVKIGEQEASSIKIKNGNDKIIAKFCMDDLLEIKTDLKRTISVTNPDAEKEKADKKIDLTKVTYELRDEDFSSLNPNQTANIQKALASLGFLDAQYITNYYGPITIEAIKEFQIFCNLEATGVFDAKTENKLIKKLYQ